MSLFVIATPIGNEEDISFRAVKILKSVSVIIGEERKIVSKFLRGLEIKPESIELLNEHSSKDDLNYLLEICKTQDVCLVSDCGSPGFCDPGANLVSLCRENNIRVRSVPGASSLMSFISLCGLDLKTFLFEGFLPANTQDRLERLKQLKTTSIPIILMDTPYRLRKLLGALKEVYPKNTIVLGMDLTKGEEIITEAIPADLLKKIDKAELKEKAEFIMMLKPLISETSIRQKSNMNSKNNRSNEKRNTWKNKRRSGRS